MIKFANQIMTKQESKPQFSVQIVGEPPEGGGRLSRILTEFTLEHPDVVQIDVTDQETLSQALPTLLGKAYEEADRVLGEEEEEGK